MFRKIATLLIGMAVAISAYEVELDGIGTVDIPDGVVDTVFAEEFKDFYNEYDFEEMYEVVTGCIGDAHYSEQGDAVVALYNFKNSTTFNNKLFIRSGYPFALGWYNTRTSEIAINIQYLYRHTREKLLYILLHEATHDIQFKEGWMDDDTPIETVINEVFADLSAIRSTVTLTGCSTEYAVGLRQSTRVLSKYVDEESRATATILLDYVIMEQSYKLIMGE